MAESGARPSLRAAQGAWIALAVAASVHVVVSPEKHNLWPVFREGGRGWWTGENIYVGVHYFSYSPVFAVLLWPFTVLPGVVGNVLFDIGGLALLFYAIRRLTRVVFPETVLSRNEPAVLLLSLIGVVRPVWSSQAHTWCAALVFLAAVALVERRWWMAAITLGLAVHLKLAPLALAGVVAWNWRRAMAPRLAAAVGGWALLPLARGRPSYALSMYAQWRERLEILSARRFPSFRDAAHVFELLGAPAAGTGYRVLQVTAAVAVLVWTSRLRRRGVETTWLVSGCFALTIVYMLIFGPAVEFTQYPLLVPWVAASMLAARAGTPERALLLGVFLLTTVAGIGAVEDALSSVSGSRAPEAFLTLGTLIFGAWILVRWRRAPAAASGDSGGASLRPAR